MNSVGTSQKCDEIDQNVGNESKSGGVEINSDNAACAKPDIFSNRDTSNLSGVKFDSDVLSSQEYLNRVQYAFKLGFSEVQLQQALTELGTATPKDNDLLQELIKRGRIGKSLDEESDLEEDDDEDVFSDSSSSLLSPPPNMDKPNLGIDSNLRKIVIDGSNVAMSHGNKVTFSCYGIKLAVDFFRRRGHKDITVFVPLWRKETPRADSPITNQEVLFALEKEQQLVYTPSRRVGGKRVVCYDDRFVIQLAADTDGIVVSNDNYRDLINEEPSFKKVIEERLLMYSFVNDRFMPPADPLGRHGPTLDNFLQKEPNQPETLPPICPYQKKCTYGNKCKYYHPERGNKPQRMITERLAEEAQLKMLEVKERQLTEHSDDSIEAKAKKVPRDPVKVALEEKERQRKQNENLDHYRRQIEESERKAALAKSSLQDNQENDSLPVIFPPSRPSISLSDGTHLSVAKTLSDQGISLSHAKYRNQRRKSVPSETPDREVESIRRQLSRQVSLQPSYERQGGAPWSTYPAGPDSIETLRPVPPPPSQAAMQSFPPTRPNMSYQPHVNRGDYSYPPRPQEYYVARSAGAGAPPFTFHPSSMSYPNPAVHHRSGRPLQPSYPPMQYNSVYHQSQTLVQQSVPNLAHRWVPTGGYDGHMYPELPDQNALSYVTGPPVENEVDYWRESHYQMPPPENPYGSTTIPENSPVAMVPPPPKITDQQRYAVYANLSNIYGEEIVRRVMHEHPQEKRAHIIATYAAQVPSQ